MEPINEDTKLEILDALREAERELRRYDAKLASMVTCLRGLVGAHGLNQPRECHIARHLAECAEEYARKQDACVHCGASGAARRDLGAHGRHVNLCEACDRAVNVGGPCPLGADCPEEHGVQS